MGKTASGILSFALSIIFIFSAQAETTFKWGPYLRLRHEFWKNLFDMNSAALDNRNYFRTKTSLWFEAKKDSKASLFIKLTNENKAYTYFRQASGKKGYHYDINEVVFDNLYFDIKSIADLPLDLRFGRQDFLGMYGEHFILGDGTPGDGSRTYYFNAVKLSWHVNEKNILDVLYIKNNNTDDFLPIINRVDGEQSLNTSDEKAYGLYHKSDSIKNLHWENYYIYKLEEAGASGLVAKTTKLNTIGSFARYTFADSALRAQLAYQFGHYGNSTRRGLGGYIFADHDFKDVALKPQLSCGYSYLSGDDRATDKNEAWDPIFSRTPWMSELYSLSYNGETGALCYWTNLTMYRAALLLNPTPKIKITFWYNFLRANQSVAATGTTFGSGKKRGELPQARLDYSFNKNVSAYFLAEYFMPGNFYTTEADEALFLRTELQIKF